jgi:hypothetical protein
LAEEGEVLTDLGVLDAEGLAELTARDLVQALMLEGLQLPQVKTDPADDRLRGQLRVRMPVS